MNDQLKNDLFRAKIGFIENASLRDYSTFRIGGPCPMLIKPSDSDQLETTVKLLDARQTGFMVLGGGSNVLISDNGVNESVIVTAGQSDDIQREQSMLIVSAGTKLDHVVAYAAKHGLKGLNHLSGIPGTIGGAIFGNAGTQEGEIGDCVKEIVTVSHGGQVRAYSYMDASFAYRRSIFSEVDDIILFVHLQLEPDDSDALMAQRHKTLRARFEKFGDYYTLRCAGSFFKNVVMPDGESKAAGWLLEQAGCKGLSYGEASVFERHANIIINHGNATANDVLQLSQMMKQRVLERFGVELEPEVRFVS